MYLKKYYFIFLNALTVAFAGCEKTELINSEENKCNDQSNESVKSINGVLYFNSDESFQNYVVQYQSMTREERQNYESKMNFKSQATIFDEIVEAELAHDEPYKNMSEEELGRISNLPPLHSEVYYSYLEKGIIKELNKGTDDEYFVLSQPNPAVWPVINENGLVAIGGMMYQYTENSNKRILGTTLEKVERLQQATETNEKEGIFVETYSNLKYGVDYINETSAWVSSGGGKKGEKRINIRLYYKAELYITNGPVYRVYHNVYVKCQERNWRRKWKYVWTPVWVNGDWYFRYFPNSEGNYKEFQPAYHEYFPSANNISASISPMSGSEAPYQSYWTWYGPDEYMWIEPTCHYTGTWSATRYGGSNGLTATLEL